MRGLLGGIAVGLLSLVLASAQAADTRSLAYLDQSDPFYVSRDFPKLITPQWVGEPGVEAVVILSIDDMRGHERWEEYLRPILERLKKIDGRAPVSIMTCQIDPREPHLQKWLAEGVSLETHTLDHPCPLLGGGNLAAAKATYDRCIDQMNAVPGSRAVAFRMPCCDSQNTPSPRFYSEIFNGKTPLGGFLEIDSSVFNITTANDPELPRELVVDGHGHEIFRRYLPFKSYVVTVEDYPYPYVIGNRCWEFPCTVPSDWSAQHVQKADNPRTVEDLKRALDAAVVKRGVFTLVFHPHKWIKPEQIVELIDHAVAKHGNKVKFLNFREAAERLNKNVLGGHKLRDAEGGDHGVRMLDVDRDGYLDVAVGDNELRGMRVWLPGQGAWAQRSFPLDFDSAHDVRFGVIHADGRPTIFDGQRQAWYYERGAWVQDPRLVRGLQANEPVEALRLVDLDGDGIDELLTRSGGASTPQHKIYGYQQNAWSRLPFSLPEGVQLTDAQGRDAGLRFFDLDQNGSLDILASNETGYSAHLFESRDKGWARELVRGKPGDAGAIPMITRDGSNQGAWIHGRTLWVQNENTDKLPDLVDRFPLDKLLESVLFPGPKSPAMALATMHVRPGFKVDLAVHEPLVLDPVSIAFGPDGKLWVAEMGDYPRGADGRGAKGGVIRYLEDTDDDGRYDQSTVFLDDLGYPNGVTPWRKGVLITCAPDVIYAEDTDSDGRADKRGVLYSGFLEGNPQHRANGFKWGMDGWLYGAHADSKDGIKLHKRDQVVNASGRDFRIRPDQGLLDPQSGVSQYGRSRDDWDNWFGNENSNPMFHYILADHYLRRNENVPALDGKSDVSDQPGVAEVFPASRTLARYNDLYAANRFTSANSTIVYRDDLFGPAFENNAYVSEPVHNLVHREIMRPEGITFRSKRDEDERDSEFLASADNWFRPATIVTGPDGALWVADMYRQTIEHPEWIPQSIQDQVDLRAGSDMGRIYRVYPVGTTPRKIPRLDKLSTAQLVAALDSPSGWQRDMVQQMLIWNPDPAAIEPLHKLVADCQRPITRTQALWTLELLGQATPAEIAKAMKDPHPGVRRHAIQIAENHFHTPQAAELGEGILALAGDEDLQLQLQRAYTLGQWSDPRAGDALGEIALKYQDNPYLVAAVLSSVKPENLAGVTKRVLGVAAPAEPPAELLEQLVGLATAFEDDDTLAAALERIGAPHEGKYADWQLTALAGLLDALDAEQADWRKYDPKQSLAKMFAFARTAIADEGAAEEQRIRASRLLGRSADTQTEDIASLVALLVPQSSGLVQEAAVVALARIDSPEVPPALLSGWRSHGPELRSQVLDVLLGRPSGSKALLAAIERGEVPAADIDAARRQRLQQSDDAEIKTQAAKLLAGAIASNRAQVVAEHQSVLEAAGDIAAGGAVFKKRCSVCHRLRGEGVEVGPDLASLTDYSPQALLTAMLDPNKAVEAKYLDYVAVTTSGVSHTGLLVNETGNSVTLKGQEGKQQTILRNELEVLQATGKSLMPEGLEKDLSKDDLANVIAFLRGSGAPRKVFESNSPRLITPTTDGTLQLYPTNCEIYGPTIVLEQLYKNLGEWQSENDKAVWNIELPKAGRYQMRLNYACLDADAGNTWLLEAGPSQLTGQVSATGSKDRYQDIPCGEIELPAGASQVTLRSAGPVKGKLLQLGGVLLVPAE